MIVYDKQHPPFVGVNKYIDRFGAETNERITAEFIPEEFWPRMHQRWNDGDFSNQELVEIIKQVTGEDPTTVNRPLTTDTLKAWEDAIKSKWEA
jgi:hypothetical protein